MSYAGLDDKKFLRTFLAESEELLEKLNDNLLELEKDAGNPESINEVFRLTHSLKSESALLGFTNLSELAHRLEDVFDRIRSGNLDLSRALMDAIFSASDLIHEVISRISTEQSDTGIDTRSVIRELQSLAGLGYESDEEQPAEEGGKEREEEQGEPPALKSFQRSQLLEARDRGESIYRLTVKVSKEAEPPYPRAYLVFNNLEMIANVIQTTPNMTIPQDDRLYRRLVVLLSSRLPEASILKACAVDLIEEQQLEVLQQEEISRLLDAQRGAGTSRFQAIRSSRIESASVRVDTTKLNEIWQLVGELTIYKAQLSQLHERLCRRGIAMRGEVERASDSLERITTEMQQAIMGTRMVPIAVLFNKFPRLVRDLSRKLGKNVDLEIQGKDTEIDRTIVEVLSDPLTHIIRNSLDHGLESPQERRRANKTEAGRISITAQQQGGKIVIEIADDGRGLDVKKIREKAHIGSEVSDEEAVQYIFSPGFSTKEDVTDLSGRGVGMDVVATRIREDLKGEVEVRSDPGRGTLIRILLPLTLTILHSLVISCGGSHYAIPAGDISETVKVTDQDIAKDAAGEIYDYNGERMPLIHLDSLLLGPENGNVSRARENNAVVIEQRREKVCLLVDELVEEEDLVIKPISDLLNQRRLFSGVSVLGDGRIIFILDTAKVLESIESGGFDGV